ncbi:HD domain-containing protein [Planctomycetota bacterium]
MSCWKKVFGEVQELKENTLAKSRQICRLAALLHDTGHSCFSHAAETVFHPDAKHESLTVLLMKSQEHLKPILEDEYFPQCAELTADLIQPDPQRSIPQIRILRDIISGQVDADRTDYLLRDSHHCGVDYGRFDYRRLIECLSVWQNEYSGELEMAIGADGIHSFESLILARHQMNTQVYYHRLRLIYDLYLKNYFLDQDRDKFDTPEKVLRWNDIRAMQEIFTAAEQNGSPGHQWAKRIVDRSHHRDVFSIDEGSGIAALKNAKITYDKIKAEFTDIDFIADLRDKPVNIHKILRPEDQDDGIGFPMIRRGAKSALGQRSLILKTLPKSFRIGVLFADTKEKAKRKEIGSRCRAIFQELN